VPYTVSSDRLADNLRQPAGDLTNLDTDFSVEGGTACRLPGAHQPLAQAVDQRAIIGREVIAEAIDGLDDNSPLRETCDSTERVEPRLEFEWNPNAELRVILDLFAFFGPSWRTAGTSSIFGQSVVGHSRVGWQCTAEMRALRRASDTCRHR
jgi:hypothetical protein